MGQLDQVMNNALRQHQSGMLAEAERAYRQVLEQDPNHPEALHLLGVLCAQVGKADEGLTYVRRALEIRPNSAVYRSNLGNVYRTMGRLQDAIAAYQQAITIDPNHADAFSNMGLSYQELGHVDAAIDNYHRAMAIHPGHPDASRHLQTALSLRGQAIADANAANGQPNTSAGYYQPTGSSPYYPTNGMDPTSPITGPVTSPPPPPADPNALNKQGNALLRQGNHAAAAEMYRKALEVQPTYSGAHNNLAIALQDMGLKSQAEYHYRQAIEHDNDYMAAYSNLGNLLRGQGKLDEAEEIFQAALDKNPNHALAHVNYGNVIRDKGDFQRAVEYYQKALDLDAECAEAVANMGNSLREIGRPVEAAEYCRRAIEATPDSHSPHVNLAMALLLAGDFEAGWPEYEWRWKNEKFVSPYFQPRSDTPEWDGSPLDGRTLILHTEQGLGDALMFARYVSLIPKDHGRIILFAQASLVPLLRSIDIVDEVYERSGPVPDYDIHLPIMSLARIYNTTIETIPNNGAYIHPGDDLRRHVLNIIGDSRTFRIGINWQGNPKFPHDCFRSFPLRHFERLAQLPNVTLFSLQHGAGTEQIKEVADTFSVTNLGESLDLLAKSLPGHIGANRMSLAAAAIAEMDLVITSDTMLAHLAGALDQDTMTIVPFAPDWRYTMDRDVCPWYPSMRIFRPDSSTGWSAAFDGVVDAVSRIDFEQAIDTRTKQDQDLCSRCDIDAEVTNEALARVRASSVLANRVRRPNIMFSTTRMWNPGDEFIMFGVEELLKPIIGDFNAIAYNRNPDLHLPRAGKLPEQIVADGTTYPIIWKYDNSWREPDHNKELDLVVFSGTPEWTGFMVSPLTKSLRETEIPVMYLGVGSFENIKGQTYDQLSQVDRDITSRAKLVTVRDRDCAQILAPLGPHQLPCPALFSAKTNRLRTNINRIALSTQGRTGSTRQPIPEHVWQYTLTLFNKLSERYDCTLVAHYIDELHCLRPDLNDNIDFRYSYDARDYEAIYDDFDITISTRVHGAGMCASLGIPGYLISHSARTGTAEGFLAHIIDPTTSPIDRVIAQIESMDIESESARLIEHKQTARERYTELLTPVLRESLPFCFE